jgi:hypothetical protein
MKFETINEAVEVITYFHNKEMKPIRFRWRDRAYHVLNVNGVWHDVVGRDREYHFHVATKESGTFELIYNTGGFVWKIGRVCVDD